MSGPTVTSKAPLLWRLYSRQLESTVNSSGDTGKGPLAAERFMALHSLSTR